MSVNKGDNQAAAIMDAVGKPTTNMNPVMSGKPEMRNFVKFLSFYQFLPNIVRTVARFTE